MLALPTLSKALLVIVTKQLLPVSVNILADWSPADSETVTVSLSVATNELLDYKGV